MGIKYFVNEKFFSSWGKNMAYVLGYIYADGNLEYSPKIRGRYLRISSTDKNTIIKIKKWLSSKHTIVKSKSHWKNGKDQYLLRIGNSNLYESLMKLGLYPKKSLTIELPKIPKKYIMDFVRGYFDGDGCVYPYIVEGKNNKIYARKLSTIFTSGSKKFLLQLSILLNKEFGLNLIKISNNSRSYQLRYSTNDSIKYYKLLYKNCKKGDYLERKYKKFEKFISIRNGPVAKLVKRYSLQNCHSPVQIRPGPQ